MTPTTTIHWRLRELAEPLRWNPNKLAQATGLSRNTIRLLWEDRAKLADLGTLEALARVLGVAPSDLLTTIAHDSAQD